jgi:serine/threonine-protein kinase
MSSAPTSATAAVTRALPDHLREWELPVGWRWGGEGRWGEHRHYQEVVDALGRSLALVSVPDPAHAAWLSGEARHLAHRNHPSIPTTYHYWSVQGSVRRGPGYLRRWLAGETVGERLAESGREGTPYCIELLRTIGSTLAYIHSAGGTHGALSPHSVWGTPGDRFWLLGWEWAMPRGEIPEGYAPDRARLAAPPEWPADRWTPTAESDQWQLAATAFAALSGELPPASDMPPVSLVCPECPDALARVLTRALASDPAARYPTVSALLRELDRAVGSTRTSMIVSGSVLSPMAMRNTEEGRLRWALGDDYEVRSRLGAGTFGSVWRVRDLTLEREVALKMLHPQVAGDAVAVRRFRREAQLAGQLAHPAIVPIYDWDSNAGVAWYTMELAEGGSLADLVRRAGPRPLGDVAAPVEQLLDGLAVAHAVGIIHRDLKPENILIDRYGRWRISDFGVARIGGEELAGTTGTPEFAAPEQLLGEPQGTAVDCYGVGAITAFVLTGRPPFGDGDGRGIVARQLAGQSDLGVLPPPLLAFLRRALAPTPDERFADAASMRDAWRVAAANSLDRDHNGRWWRRWLHGEDAPPVAP